MRRVDGAGQSRESTNKQNMDKQYDNGQSTDSRTQKGRT